MASVICMDPAMLHSRLSQGSVVLVDVRESHEHAQAAIAGAQLLPMSTITYDQLSALQRDDVLLVLHCHLGRRSWDVCQAMIEEGFAHDIATLEGGIVAWEEAGFEVIQPQG